MAIAAQEAVALGQDFTGTEHILLGLLACEDVIAAPLLARYGIAAGEIRSQVAGSGGLGGHESQGAQSLTARAKQVLTLAAAEAGRLGDDAVQPEHLLLGIIRQATGVAALVLRNMGVELAELREEVLEARYVHEVALEDSSGDGGGARARTAGAESVPDGAGAAYGAPSGAAPREGRPTDEPDGAVAGPVREIVAPLCPGCGQRLSEVLAAAAVAPSGSTASGRRRSFGNVTLIFCGACGHTLSATR
jgi:ATP-dependent Clp protease ATP-binding subunit ClpA